MAVHGRGSSELGCRRPMLGDGLRCRNIQNFTLMILRLFENFVDLWPFKRMIVTRSFDDNMSVISLHAIDLHNPLRANGLSHVLNRCTLSERLGMYQSHNHDTSKCNMEIGMV